MTILLSSLSLFPATLEQKLETRQRSYPHWGRGLTQEQYLARDAQLDPQEHAADGKLTTWVLAPRDDPTTLEFKCSCETYRRNALVRRAGSATPEDVVGYSIASVFTPPANRGKGFAHHMMRLLHWVIAPRAVLPPFPAAWGSPPPEVPGCGNARFSALYSDVGNFYNAAGPDETVGGWVVRDPIGTIWEVPKVAGQESDAGANVQWLDEEGAKAFWKEDVKQMRAEMARSTSSRTLFSFLPDEGVGAFLIRRTIYFLPGQTYEVPRKWGVVLPSSGTEGTTPAFATWTLDVGPPPATLIITRLRATPATFPQLVSSCIEAARECGMERVEVWNLPQELVEISSGLNGKTDTRDEHLNAFKWYGPEKDEDIEWLFNEKFCWC